MPTPPLPRSASSRHRASAPHDIDVWVASASADGAPYLVPLSFDWDGEALLVATPTDSPTGRNLAATRAVRLGLGHTRDVSIIEGEVEVLEIDALPQQRGSGSRHRCWTTTSAAATHRGARDVGDRGRGVLRRRRGAPAGRAHHPRPACPRWCARR